MRWARTTRGRVRGRTRYETRVFRWHLWFWRASVGRKRAGRAGWIVGRFAIGCIAIAEGPEGLRDRPRGGTACFLDDAQLAVVRGWMESGPDVDRDGVVRWRVRDILRKIEAAFVVALCGRERSPAAPKGGVSLRFGTPDASERVKESRRLVWRCLPVRRGSRALAADFGLAWRIYPGVGPHDCAAAGFQPLFGAGRARRGRARRSSGGDSEAMTALQIVRQSVQQSHRPHLDKPADRKTPQPPSFDHAVDRLDAQPAAIDRLPFLARQSRNATGSLSSRRSRLRTLAAVAVRLTGGGMSTSTPFPPNATGSCRVA